MTDSGTGRDEETVAGPANMAVPAEEPVATTAVPAAPVYPAPVYAAPVAPAATGGPGRFARTPTWSRYLVVAIVALVLGGLLGSGITALAMHGRGPGSRPGFSRPIGPRGAPFGGQGNRGGFGNRGNGGGFGQRGGFGNGVPGGPTAAPGQTAAPTPAPTTTG